MRPECIDAVTRAIGRPISAAEAQGIEERLSEAMRQLGRRDPQRWQSLPAAERLREAAKFAGDQLEHDLAVKRTRLALQIRSHDANLAVYRELTAGGEKPFGAVAEILDRADIARKGVERQYFSRMIQTLEATEPRFFGLLEDARGVRDLVAEIFGKDTGNPVAKAGAKAWLETVESMRQRFNRGGGDIGKLRYGYLPQPHDPARIRAVAADIWATKVLPLIDRSRYVDEAGRQLDDVALSDVLTMMYRTLVSEGVNKIEPGEYRGLSLIHI